MQLAGSVEPSVRHQISSSKSALAGAALAIGLEAIAMRVGGGGCRRGERTGDKGEQGGHDDEALHVAFLDAGYWQLPADRRLVTRIVAATMRPADRGRILHMDEAAKDRVVAPARIAIP
jgi:hypothetical protein